MHFHVADAYHDTGSQIHAADARIKVGLAFLLILLVGLTPIGAFGSYLGFFILVMVGALLARIDPLVIAKRSMIALPFAGAAVTLIFTVPGNVLGTVPVFGWSFTEEGIVRFASILFKSVISVQIGALLMVTTHLTEMLWALGALRVPRVLVAIISFMYRYIFIFVDEALRLTRARDARSAVLHRRPSLIFRARTTGRMIGSLILRSYERSERVYQAMVARGYQGELRQLQLPVLQVYDVLLGAIPLLIGIMLLGLGLWFAGK